MLGVFGQKMIGSAWKRELVCGRAKGLFFFEATYCYCLLLNMLIDRIGIGSQEVVAG